MAATNNQTGIVLLAAGGSARLGSPKQMLAYAGTTLLQHSINQAMASMAASIVVVLCPGAATFQIQPADNRLHFIINEQWKEGMASSIRCGLEYLTHRFLNLQHVLFMACDQPFVQAELLDKLVTLQQETGKAIAAGTYAGITGIPAVFDKTIFPELMLLTGDKGAKKLIEQHRQQVVTVDFPQGAIDIDTRDDYQNLQKITNTE